MRKLLPLLFLSAGAWAQDRETLTVGTAAAGRGATARGFIEVPAGSDPALRIPVAVVHGAKPGPVLALVAGSHGTEYASVVALADLVDALDPAELAGSVIIVPIVNVPSFDKVVPHLNPVDGKNMNRTYPGRQDGTQSERASYAVTRQVVEQSDHLIDYHGGDLDESLRPYSYWSKTGREAQDRISREMVLAFGLDHIVVSTGRPEDPNASVYLENTATTRGKPSITVEAGHAGTVMREDVEALVRGTLSVMRHLKMLPGAPTPIENPVWIGTLHSLYRFGRGAVPSARRARELRAEGDDRGDRHRLPGEEAFRGPRAGSRRRPLHPGRSVGGERRDSRERRRGSRMS